MAEIRYGPSQAAGVSSGGPRQIIVTVPDSVEKRRRAIRKRAPMPADDVVRVKRRPASAVAMVDEDMAEAVPADEAPPSDEFEAPEADEAPAPADEAPPAEEPPQAQAPMPAGEAVPPVPARPYMRGNHKTPQTHGCTRCRWRIFGCNGLCRKWAAAGTHHRSFGPAGEVINNTPPRCSKILIE